ncbi:MAG: hypothetical protein LBB53_04115 [Prevotellaceae bacterium]|jgi:nitrite reductase/ring-hydroxylating ferredoxin subunit|nr:hypothetical protein [Prevotellaceae bacterium]
MKKFQIIILIILSAGCGNKRSPIPDMPVNLEFNIVAAAPELSAFGSFKEFTEQQNMSQALGYGGIVVFHTFDGVFCAFDMSCPVEAKPDVRIATDNTGTARCTKCNAEFFLGDGNAFPIKGNSKFPLRKYSVYYSAIMNSILVTN